MSKFYENIIYAAAYGLYIWGLWSQKWEAELFLLEVLILDYVSILLSFNVSWNIWF